MNISIPEEVKSILDIFNDAHYEIYIVGGAVRDLLMGKLVNDWDFTTNATPQEILKLFPKGFYNNKFGTVGIPRSEGFDIHEITTFRTESSYKDARHPEKVECSKSLTEELKTRDFTINAMAAVDSKTIMKSYKEIKELSKK